MIKHASVLPVSTNEMMKERRTRHESQDHIGPCCLMSGASSQYSWRFVLENENTFVKKCAAALWCSLDDIISQRRHLERSASDASITAAD